MPQFGEIYRRLALSGGKRVFEDLNRRSADSEGNSTFLSRPLSVRRVVINIWQFISFSFLFFFSSSPSNGPIRVKHAVTSRATSRDVNLLVLHLFFGQPDS